MMKTEERKLLGPGQEFGYIWSVNKKENSSNGKVKASKRHAIEPDLESKVTVFKWRN